jgi:hypothetical protein
MIKYLNTDILYQHRFDSISEQDGFIKGITVIREGEAKGHNLFINSSFLDDVVRLGNERSAGIKARFGHPNICSTALGTYLGRYKNFRKIDDKVVADLFLDASAKTSPKGNLYDYVLNLAKTNPDMFGASISFKRGDSTFETIQVNGKDLKREFASITDLYATDLVDDPAATDGLFETFQHEDLASQVTLFLDSHPELFTLIDKQPDLITEFIIKYNNYKAHSVSELPSLLREGSGGESTATSKLNSINMNITDEFTSLKNWLKENFTLKSKPDDFELQVNQKLSEFEKLIAPQSDFQKEKEGLDTKISELTGQNKTLEDKILGLESKINQLEAGGTSLESEGDPSLNISKPVDQAGKELLQAIPEDQKRQFKIHSNKVSQSKSE